jgi:amino acid adenylation domain-containing protein
MSSDPTLTDPMLAERRWLRESAPARDVECRGPELPLQDADSAAGQRRWVDDEVLRGQADYWARTLAGAPGLLELPADHPRPAQQDFSGGVVRIDLDEALTAGLQALSRRHQATLSMTLLAGWAVLLSRLSGQDDVVVGTPAAGRGGAEGEGLAGSFVNILALRVDLSGRPTVAELIGRVKERALEAQHHQDLSFAQVVERVDPARSLAHHPLFQVMFIGQDLPRGSLGGSALDGGDAEGAASPEVRAAFDLALSLRAAGERIVGGLAYATALFERATVERYANCLRRVLEEMAADEHRRVERLGLLPPEERSRVLDAWNRTEAPYPVESCVHELFQAQVARTPHAVALVHEDGELTYAELNARANRLAHHLAARGVGPDVCVGLCLERGPEMIVALLAVLKAGGAYVPLDPEYPAERLEYMLADAAPAVLLTQASLAGLLAGAEVPRVRVDADAAEWAHASGANLERGALTPDHLAYVIYTSGSTGRPKGVMNQHRALANRLAWGRRVWEIDADEVLLCKTSLNFDGSVREILLPLVAGGRIVIARAGGHHDPSSLLEVIGREGITTVNLVPSLLQALLDAPEVENLRALRRVLCGGEALPGALLERFRAALPGVDLHNLYGPSEAATAVTATRPPAEAGRAVVPIGGPSANARVYVLDGAGEPVPVGVAGELYIGGVPVARGYLRRAALTAERFVPDCFGGEPGARLYRTGDVVRWLPEGRLSFVGRDDAQVKVRGFRVELGEIEARLREHPGVREAVVLVREDVPGDRRLVAYCAVDAPVEVHSLRAHLAGRLPEYMVPAAYVRLESLPLSPNGKLDRRALPAPGDDAYARDGFEAPVGETEGGLAGIWTEVLGLERVGRRDNFFALGGHSLLAARVIARMRQALGVEIPLTHVFSHPTVESLAARLAAPEAADSADRAVAVRATGAEPPLFLAYTGTGSVAYAQVLHPHVGGDVPVYALPAPPLSDGQPRTVEAMAARLLRMIREVQPAGPYRVAGWSFGGVLAYEIAAQLVGRNETVEFLGMIDSYAPAYGHAMDAADADAGGGGGGAPSPETAGSADDDGDADLETYAARLRAEGRLSAHATVPQLREMRDRGRVNQQAGRGYDPRPLPVVVHFFTAGESPMEDPSRGWRALLPERSLRVTPVPGTHHSMMDPSNAAVLGEALSRCLRSGSARS